MTESKKVVCGGCNSTVRIPAQRLNEAPRCPSCHQPLFSGHPVELKPTTFGKHLNSTDVPVIVDFWAPWCGPCRTMAPVFAEVAQRVEPKARFAKINADDVPDLMSQFGIRGIPTLIAFKAGKEVARQSGAMDRATLTRWLEGVLT
jgi:thioredoxin 2